MPRLASSLRRAASPDSVTRRGPKSEITWRRGQVCGHYGARHLFARLRKTNAASLQKIPSKNALVHLPDDCRVTRREPATNIRAVVKNFRKEPRAFGRRARQRPPQRPMETPCCQWRDHVPAAGLLTSVPGAWTFPQAAPPLPPTPAALHQTRPRKRRWARSVSMKSLM